MVHEQENVGFWANAWDSFLNFFIAIWGAFFSLFDGIPEYAFAVVFYLLGSIFMLWGWFSISKPFPRTLRITFGIFMFAVLLTPTISEGTNAAIAPATFGLLFGLLTKEMYLVWVNLASIIFVIAIGCLLMYCYSYYINYRNRQISK